MAKPKKRKTRSAKKSKAKKTKKTKKKSKPKRRRKRSKPTKLVFQDRKKLEDEEPPEGYIINLGEVIQDEAYAIILARLTDAHSALPDGYMGHVSVVPMADGSVDGELYVTVPEGSTTRDTEFDLYDAFGSISVGPGYWMSTGARWVPVVDDEHYKRNKGMTEVQTNYQRATRANIVEEHLILRQHIIRGMEKRVEFANEQAHSVFIRLHWNPQNEQPKR